MPIAATIQRDAKPLVGRSYDFGAGLGARAGLRLERRGASLLGVGYRAYWLATLNGATSSKLVQLASAEAALPVTGGVSLGASGWVYLQRSAYTDLPSRTQSYPTLAIYLVIGR